MGSSTPATRPLIRTIMMTACPDLVRRVVRALAVTAGAGIMLVTLVVLAAAMAVTWLTCPRPAARRLTATALALTVPLAATLGLTMLLAGRDLLSAALERVLLVTAVSCGDLHPLRTGILRPTARFADRLAGRPEPRRPGIPYLLADTPVAGLALLHRVGDQFRQHGIEPYR